jgi:hypothetical protein
MFVSKSRIKKLVKNPIGGLMFLNQFLKSLKLKHRMIKEIDYRTKEWFSLVDNQELFDFMINNSDASLITDGKIKIFDKEIEVLNID